VCGVSEPTQDKLSETDYWADVHRREFPRTRPAWKTALRRAIPRRLLDARKRWWERRDWKRELRGIRVHWLWQLVEVVLRPRLAGRKGAKCLEIGSAPGRISIELWRRLGVEPHGLEYTQSGVQAQKALFAKFGLPEELAMHGDFFDDAWRSRHAESYDLVISVGFIEHFADPADVVRKHWELVRPGGILAVTVPNLNDSTPYGRLVRRFNPPVHAIHNIQTCTLDAFRKLAAQCGGEILHCGPLGGPDLRFDPDGRWSSRCVAGLLERAHPLVDRLNHLVVGRRLAAFPRLAFALGLVVAKPERGAP
jgi:2-polyprenyl-3-methyl-5-hydroxy-6-metoxy-1,4-benzoquinol methylase